MHMGGLSHRGGARQDTAAAETTTPPMIEIQLEGGVMTGIIEEALPMTRPPNLVPRHPAVEATTLAAPSPAVQLHTGFLKPQ